MDYYQILGVSKDAPQALIRARYRLLAFTTHPDLLRAGNAPERFARYAEAYQTLGDEARRRDYNAQLGITIEPRSLKSGHDLHQRLAVSQTEAQQGLVTALRFVRYDPCSLCWCSGCHRCMRQGLIAKQVEVNVKIPAGLPRSTTLLLEGKGGQTEPGGERGDLLVYVEVVRT